MKFRKCTDKYLNLKKRQYIKVAKYVSDIIEHIDMKPCKGTFEIVKEMIINNEGLSIGKNVIDTIIYSLQTFLPWIPVFIAVIINVVIAIGSDDVTVFKTVNFWIDIILIHIAGILVDFFIRTVSARTENMYLRILKEMTYEQYESLIESINEELNEERKNTALNQNRTINKRIKTEVGEMRKYINYFIKNNKIIHGLGIGAILYGVLCLVFKLSDVLNVNEKIRIIGEYLNNVGISIIAAYVFLFFQNWVIFKREFLTIKYAKKFINLYLLKDCLILQEQLKLIENKIKSEAELNEGIARTCKKIRDELQLCLGTYKSVLSDNMYDKMNELLFDDCFFMIENRATGNLLNMSMRNILKDKMYYGKIDSIIEEIRLEYSNL